MQSRESKSNGTDENESESGKLKVCCQQKKRAKFCRKSKTKLNAQPNRKRRSTFCLYSTENDT